VRIAFRPRRREEEGSYSMVTAEAARTPAKGIKPREPATSCREGSELSGPWFTCWGKASVGSLEYDNIFYYLFQTPYFDLNACACKIAPRVLFLKTLPPLLLSLLFSPKASSRID